MCPLILLAAVQDQQVPHGLGQGIRRFESLYLTRMIAPLTHALPGYSLNLRTRTPIVTMKVRKVKREPLKVAHKGSQGWLRDADGGREAHGGSLQIASDR